MSSTTARMAGWYGSDSGPHPFSLGSISEACPLPTPAGNGKIKTMGTAASDYNAGGQAVWDGCKGPNENPPTCEKNPQWARQ